MALNPILVPFCTAPDGTVISADIGSNGVQGGYPGTVSVTLSANLTILPRPLGAPRIPGYVGAAYPMDAPGVVMASGRTIEFLLPQAQAIANAGYGTIVGYE